MTGPLSGVRRRRVRRMKCSAALEASKPSSAAKPTASKTGRGGRTDAGSSDPGAAGTETPGAAKAVKTPAGKAGRAGAPMRGTPTPHACESRRARTWRHGRDAEVNTGRAA